MVSAYCDYTVEVARVVILSINDVYFYHMVCCRLGTMVSSDNNGVRDVYNVALNLTEKRLAAQSMGPLFKRISKTYFSSLTMIERLKVFSQDAIDAPIQIQRHAGESV